MTSFKLQACVACCPNLQELNIAGVLAGGVLPYALLQLSGLTSLTSLASDADTCLLAQLTGLQELSCAGATSGGSITHPGLLQLTAFKQLTRLCFAHHCKRFRELLGPSLQQQQLECSPKGSFRAFVNKVRWWKQCLHDSP